MSPSDPSLVERLLTLCAIPSVIGDEARICAHVTETAPATWTPTRVGNSVVFGGPRRAGRPLVALVGHLDTVPPHAGDPEPHVEGDRVVGLGASDMKAGLAVMQALMATHEPGAGPVDLAFVFYDREEGPYLENGLEPVLDAVEWLSRVDLAFCLEPSDNRLQLGCLGTLHARLVFNGRAAHSARPWQGRNAIHAAGRLLTALEVRPPRDFETDGLLYREVMSVTLANGGRARNVIPERFELNLNYRFAPDKGLEAAQADVHALVGGAAEVHFTDLCPSGPLWTDKPLVRALVHRCGLRPEPKQAWTDVARLAVRGIPAVNLGPGEAAQAHQARESVAIERLHEGLALYERILPVLGEIDPPTGAA